jgi:hypothetical protein
MYKAGIVLKRLNSPYKIALLDQERGRVDAIVTKAAPCVGSLLHYSIERERGNYIYLSHCTITDLPFLLARHDILFWHHVLELCFYFIPLGYRIDTLFALLEFLYSADGTTLWNIQSKKLYLFKLLAAIGLYDVLPQLVPESRVNQLLLLPLSHIMNEQLDEKSEKVMNEWLRTCIAEHPAMVKFNTVHFLGTMDDHE